jgi:hypothetical protein
MAAVGGLAGLSLWALGELWDLALLPERALVALAVLGVGFFVPLLSMTGPLPLLRALPGAVAIGVAVAALTAWAGLRFDLAADLFAEPGAVLAVVLLVWLPQPFWIARCRGGWHDYPVLFSESWGIVIRLGAALMFTGLVWLVLWLSDALLAVAGLHVIESLIAVDPVPYVLTGAVLGLALAVMAELGEMMSADLPLRLMRLLVPVVLLVIAVFAVALALGGFERLPGGLPVASTLLAAAAAAVALVSITAEGDEDETLRSPLLARAAQMLAGIALVPAGLAAWAIALRIADLGWTPARVAGAAAAAVGLGYGLAYLWAAFGGRHWAGRVRRANVAMALAVLALAAAALTPVLNPQAIAAADLLARQADGRTPPDRLDLPALRDWGRAGAVARAALEDRAAGEGQEALASRLAAEAAGEPWTEGLEPLRVAVAAAMPVSPPAAAPLAAELIAALERWELEAWRNGCDRRLPDGRPSCVLVVADFLTDRPGEEAIALIAGQGGGLDLAGFVRSADGAEWQRRPVMRLDPGGDTPAEAWIAALQDQGPRTAALPMAGLALSGGLFAIFP